jgi:hypothetical protein
MLVFNKYFYKKKKSKLYFGDCVAILNDFIYQTGGSTMLCSLLSRYNLRILSLCLVSSWINDDNVHGTAK